MFFGVTSPNFVGKIWWVKSPERLLLRSPFKPQSSQENAHAAPSYATYPRPQLAISSWTSPTPHASFSPSTDSWFVRGGALMVNLTYTVYWRDISLFAHLFPGFPFPAKNWHIDLPTRFPQFHRATSSTWGLASVAILINMSFPLSLHGDNRSQ